MKQKCKLYLATTKGLIQPGCSCNACWDMFFNHHPGKYEGAKLALEQFGIENLITTQVQQFKQAAMTRKEAVLVMQATRFAKQVQRKMRQDNPQPKVA